MKQRLLDLKAQNLQDEIDDMYSQVRNLKEQKTVLLGQTELICPKCETQHEIKDLTYICTHFYVAPSGCTDGDYWCEGEGNTFCTNCEIRIRFLCHDYDENDRQLDHPFTKMKDCFDDIIEEHERNKAGYYGETFVNLTHKSIDLVEN